MNKSDRAAAGSYLVGSSASVLLLPLNDRRDRIILFNPQHTLYVKCGQYASNTDFTYRLTSNTTLEIDNYIGVLSAIASADYTFVRVTELQ